MGRIIWGILQIVLTVVGGIGENSLIQDTHVLIQLFYDFSGNILTLIVLNQRLMRKGGVNNLLQGLAISDIVAPTFACIPHLFYYYGPRQNDSLINFINLYVTPIATGATFCSNWIGREFLLSQMTVIIAFVLYSCDDNKFSIADCTQAALFTSLLFQSE